eukprot:g708.t1
MVRKFSGVARLDNLEGSTLRELGVEELMDLLLTEEGVVVGSGSPGIMGVAGILDKRSGSSGAKVESDSLQTSSMVEEHSARSPSGSISSIADSSIAGYQSASMVASSASAVAAGGTTDVNDSFEDDINAVDNDGGRRTAYGMFHTTKDAVMAATEDDRTSSAWHNGLQRILEDQKGIGRRHNKSSVSRQRRRRQNLDNLMKLEVRIAPFVEANRSIDHGAGRDLFCLANLDMVLRLAAKFPNFYEG